MAFRTIGLARLVALGLVAFAIYIRILDPLPVQLVRNMTFDVFQQIRPRAPQPFPVAIIDVDDASITEIGQWPWPRTRFAELVDRTMQSGAVAMAFDIVFSEPDRLSPSMIAQDNPLLSDAIRAELARLPNNDDVFVDAISRGRVIVGQTSVRDATAEVDPTTKIDQVPHAIIGLDPRRYLQTFTSLLENLPQLENAATGRGVFTVLPDSDGVYRRTPLVVAVGGELRMALAPELLRVATGGQPFAVRSNEAGVDAIVVAGKSIQTAANGTVRPYLTPSLDSRLVSAADLLKGRVPPERLAGHLVFVGTSAIGLEDYRATALGVQMPGVEIHAQLLENILSDTLLKRPNYATATELVAMVLICLVIIILAPIMNATILIISTLILLGSIAWGSFNVFARNLILVDSSFVILSGLATIMFMSASNYLREERRRQKIRSAFGQYVSKDLVAEISDNAGSLELGGETRELTLLFSDVRGFTAIAEGFRHNPQGLTALMNRFLNLLSERILEEGGTIDKFMGDAVMAFWNAPTNHDHHEHAACTAALKMRDAVNRLNEARRKEAENSGESHLPIDIGIGINTGSCVVGNMGSDMRFDYTAMGDAVNIASRLEGQTRIYGTPIIVGSATEEVVRAEFALIELDLLRVKGKREPERIFALLGDAEMQKETEFSELTQLNTQMLDAYRSQNWEIARTLLEKLIRRAEAQEPRLHTHYAMLMDRVDALQADPPPADWDGVQISTEK